MGFLQFLGRIPQDIGSVFNGGGGQPQQPQQQQQQAPIHQFQPMNQPQAQSITHDPMPIIKSAYEARMATPMFKPSSPQPSPLDVLKTTAQGVARGVAEVPATVANKTLPTNYSPLGKAVFGNAPIAPVQQDVKGAYQGALKGAHPGLAPVAGAADALLHVAQDVPGIGAVAKLAKAGDAASALKAATTELKPLNETGYIKVPGSGKAASGKANDIPTIASYGNKIQLTKENGYNAVPTKALDNNGKPVNIYQKVQKEGTNVKGQNLKNYYYDAQGGKLTNAQAQAAINGDARMAGVKSLVSSQPKAGGLTPSITGKPKGSSLAPKTATRGLTAGIQGSPEFSAPLKQAVSKSPAGTYTPFTNKAADQATQDFMKQSLPKAHQQVMQALTSGAGSHVPGASGNIGVQFGKQEVSNAGAVLKALDAKGKYADAQAVHDALATKLTNAGQIAQAASLIYNRTPEGLKYMAQRQLGNVGVDLSKNPDLASQMDAGIQAIKSAPDGSRAQQLATGRFHKLIGQNIPSSAGSKVVSLWKSGILSAPITAAKVGAVNPITNVLENVKDFPAAAVDKAISLKTGQRTMTAPNPQNVGAYLKTARTTGLQDAKTKLTENITMPGSSSIGLSELGGMSGTHVTNFGNGALGKLLGGYSQIASRTHGAITTPFYEGRGAQSITQSAQADALNNGLKSGTPEFNAHVQQFVANPSKIAQEQGTRASEYATSQQKTALGSAASGLQHSLPGGQFIAPITRIPGAVATQVVNYSPIGAAKTAIPAIINAIKGGSFDQRAFSEGIGRSLTGTGIMYVGAQLQGQGRLSGAYPANKSDQALWQLENKPANSLYVGGTVTKNSDGTFTYKGGNWQQIGSPGGPAGQSLLTGGQIAEGYKKGGAAGAALQGASGSAKIVTDQPYLTGVSGAMGAINSPDQAKSFLDQSAGSLIPNIIRSLAAATDSNQRQTAVSSPLTSMKNSITNGIPGLREQNQPQVDVFGNTQKRQQGPVGTMLNPFRPQSSNSNPITQSLESIRANNRNDTGTPLSTPSQINKKYPITQDNGKKTQLSDSQRTQFIQNTGAKAQGEVNQIISSPTFKNAPPAEKSTMVDKAVSNQRTAAKQTLTAGGQVTSSSNTNSVTNPSKILSTAQIAIDKNNFDNSGKSYQITNGNVYQRDKAGNITVTPKEVYDYSVGKATLTSQKNSGDISGWMTTAQSQLTSIDKQLKDPNTDPLQQLTLQNEGSALQKEMAKYQGYGGFTKGSGAGSGSSANTIRNKEFTALNNSFKQTKGAKLGKVSFPKAPRVGSVAFSGKAPRSPTPGGGKAIRLKKGVFA